MINKTLIVNGLIPPGKILCKDIILRFTDEQICDFCLNFPGVYIKLYNHMMWKLIFETDAIQTNREEHTALDHFSDRYFHLSGFHHAGVPGEVQFQSSGERNRALGLCDSNCPYC